MAIGTNGKLEWESNNSSKKSVKTWKAHMPRSSNATYTRASIKFWCYMMREVTGLAMPMMPKRDMVAPSSSLA